jgi:hypothetical protein
MISKLVIYANSLSTPEQKISVVYDQVKRPLSLQLLYYYGCKVITLDSKTLRLLYNKKYKRTKTMRSRHLDGLAADLILYINGEYQTDSAAYEFLGDYWEELGGTWIARETGYDGNHFQLD